MVDQYSISEGTDVYGSDGEKVGSVVAVQPNYVVVEKGFFFPTDYYIPTSAVASAEEGRVYLNVTKDAALNQGWDTEPTGGYATDMGATTTTGTMVDSVAPASTSAYDTGMATTGTTTTGATDMGYGADVSRTDAGMDVAATAAVETTRVSGSDTISVPVHEESLSAVKTQREIGEVEITKDVVSEERILEVPVTEERVRVQRRVVDRPLDASDATAFEGGTIDVPIMGEEVSLQKTVRVAEEVEIGKEAVQRTEQVAGTVRREEVRVSENVVEGGTTTGTTGTTGSATTRTTSTTTGSGTTGTTGEGEGLLDQATDAVRNAGRNS